MFTTSNMQLQLKGTRETSRESIKYFVKAFLNVAKMCWKLRTLTTILQKEWGKE